MPDNVIDEMARPEDFPGNEAEVGMQAVVHVDIRRAAVAQEGMGKEEALVEGMEGAIRPPPEKVAIGGKAGARFPALGEAGPDAKGGVDIDKVDPAPVFGEERGENPQVLAVDEKVGPSLAGQDFPMMEGDAKRGGVGLPPLPPGVVFPLPDQLRGADGKGVGVGIATQRIVTMGI